MSLDEALQTIQRRRPQAQPIPAFIEILKQYEEKHGSSNMAKRGPNDTFNTNDKKRRKKGPSIGPSIGPEGPPPRTVGPQRPAMTSAATAASNDSNGPLTSVTDGNDEIGPSLPSSQNLVEPIGPSLPKIQEKQPMGPLPPQKD